MARMIGIDDVARILWDHHFHDGDGLQALCDVKEILEAVRGHPGAVDIVRCKDCKQWYVDLGWKGKCWCCVRQCMTRPDWYCWDGEREELTDDTP